MCPKGWWDSIDNQRRFLLEHFLPVCIRRQKGLPEDYQFAETSELLDAFYSIGIAELRKDGAGTLYTRYRSIPKMVTTVFPDHAWDLDRLVLSTNITS